MQDVFMMMHLIKMFQDVFFALFHLSTFSNLTVVIVSDSIAAGLICVGGGWSAVR